MRAVTLDYQERRLRERELAAPEIRKPTQVLMRVLEAGVCGTDRELANFRFGSPPEGESHLILGHEALGQVIATGNAVTTMKAGDLVAPMIRRACSPACISCGRSRRDLCVTGDYRERGITGAHGYFAEYAVDEAEDLVEVPAALTEFGVLLEPLSVVEKAVEIALRLHEPGARSAVVLGAGAIGILSALVLQLRGLEVTVCSLECEDSPRADLLRRAGVLYSNAVGEKVDILIEATGAASAGLHGLTLLGPLGVMVVLGASVGEGKISFLDLVVQNQMIAGTVNASPESFTTAVQDLGRLNPSILRGMIHRVGFSDFENSILGPPHMSPKVVHAL
jgi:threonine dehydrogenase-like Zn-dependent dehydrogenase